MLDISHKWCIELTDENREEVGSFWNKHANATLYTRISSGVFLHSHNLSSGDWLLGPNPQANYYAYTPCKDFTVIDLKTFRMFVAECNTPLGKEMIKLNDEIWREINK